MTSGHIASLSPDGSGATRTVFLDLTTDRAVTATRRSTDSVQGPIHMSSYLGVDTTVVDRDVNLVDKNNMSDLSNVCNICNILG